MHPAQSSVPAAKHASGPRTAAAAVPQCTAVRRSPSETTDIRAPIETTGPPASVLTGDVRPSPTTERTGPRRGSAVPVSHQTHGDDGTEQIHGQTHRTPCIHTATVLSSARCESRRLSDYLSPATLSADGSALRPVVSRATGNEAADQQRGTTLRSLQRGRLERRLLCGPHYSTSCAGAAMLYFRPSNKRVTCPDRSWPHDLVPSAG